MIFILFLFLLKIKDKYIETFTKSSKCIILTTFVTENNRNMYLKKINMWLNTGIDIYLVDSNNQGFKIKNKFYKEYIFNQEKEPDHKSNTNPSLLEIRSLEKIINHHNLVNKYEYIYKITCKYFIDDYKTLNVANNENHDLILQSAFSTHMRWHNSELVGFKSNKILEILDLIKNYGDGGFERGLGWLKENDKYKYKILKKLPLNNKYGYVKRNVGDTLKYL